MTPKNQIKSWKEAVLISVGNATYAVGTQGEMPYLSKLSPEKISQFYRENGYDSIVLYRGPMMALEYIENNYGKASDAFISLEHLAKESRLLN